jgi:hypothetical protein
MIEDGEQFDREMRRYHALVRFDDSVVPPVLRFTVGEGLPDYELPLNRCNKPQRLLCAIEHLCDLPWVTKKHIQRLIDVCVERTSIRPEWPWTPSGNARYGRRD